MYSQYTHITCISQTSNRFCHVRNGKKQKLNHRFDFASLSELLVFAFCKDDGSCAFKLFQHFVLMTCCYPSVNAMELFITLTLPLPDYVCRDSYHTTGTLWITLNVIRLPIRHRKKNSNKIVLVPCGTIRFILFFDKPTVYIQASLASLVWWMA